MNNKGFSLVELIIVVAIMAVLIGVLAPTYLKYVESSKRTSDCSSIGSILDACEVIAIDPATNWGNIKVTFASTGTCTYAYASGASGNSLAALQEIAPATKISLQSDWITSGNWTIDVTKDATTGKVTFECSLVSGQTDATNPFLKYSPAMAGRLE
jgi:type IV pilus assembly protein PilA